MNAKPSEPVSPARRAAFDILSRVETQHAYAAALIAALPDSGLSREDRALTQEIVLGVLRWQLALDNLIERYAKRRVSRLDSSVLIALRIGLYQLRHLTRVPQSAAVNESVNLVKRARTASAAPLVNAVLRKAAKHLDEPPGQETIDPLEKLSVELSHPHWLLQRWHQTLGESETRQLALANNSTPGIAFRVNTLRISVSEALTNLQTAGVTTRASQVAADAFVVESGPTSATLQAAGEGVIYIQDEASQLVSILLDPRAGHRVLDLCAAPGSKTSHIAVLADDRAWVIACDRHQHRLNTLIATCQRFGIHSVDALVLDAAQSLPFLADNFDRVLVDAPCSGTGTLRSNPEIKWRLSPEDIARLAHLQYSLLISAAERVAIGGWLIYSTCSIEREENEDVVRRFLEETSKFQVIAPSAPDQLITGEGFVRTYPHKTGTDGFFAATLERVL